MVGLPYRMRFIFSVLALSVIAHAMPPVPHFVTYGDISPRTGENLSQSGRPWQSTQSVSLCQGLSLWESWTPIGGLRGLARCRRGFSYYN